MAPCSCEKAGAKSSQYPNTTRPLIPPQILRHKAPHTGICGNTEIWGASSAKHLVADQGPLMCCLNLSSFAACAIAHCVARRLRCRTDAKLDLFSRLVRNVSQAGGLL